MKQDLLRLVVAVICLFTLSACRKKSSSGHDHGSGGHVHAAPHGGQLVELGEHQFNLEFLHDPAAGKLTAYVLDGHAEAFMRITQRTIELSLNAQGQTRALALNATANAATGETVGNTSQFEASADWLKGPQDLAGKVTRVEIRGTPFSDVAFTIKSPAKP